MEDSNVTSEKDNELAELKRQLSILQTQVLKYLLILQFIFKQFYPLLFSECFRLIAVF